MSNESTLSAIDKALFALELAANIQMMIAKFNLVKAEYESEGGEIPPARLIELLDEARASFK